MRPRQGLRLLIPRMERAEKRIRREILRDQVTVYSQERIAREFPQGYDLRAVRR